MANKRNYQRELDQLIARNQAAGVRPRLLVHSCCAPCSSYVMEYLSRYFDLTMYFYNPNMDSREEYEKRAAELERLICTMNRNADAGSASLEQEPIKLVIEDYDPASFEKIAEGHETDPERGARCRLCYALRLRKTAEYMQTRNLQAAGEGTPGILPFDYFATTLTLSPLKDTEALNEIAVQIAAQYKQKYLETDFKKKNGYKRSIELSREYGLYRQNYCGCRFSKTDRQIIGNQNINKG